MNQARSEQLERALSSALIAFALLVGLVSPGAAEGLYSYIFLSLFMLIVLSLSALEEDALTIFETPDRFTTFVLIWQMLLLPAIVTLGCLLLGASDFLTTVLVASAASGAVFATPALSQVLGLNTLISARAMLLSTLIAPFSLLFFGELNGFVPHSMSFETYAVQLILYIVIPFTIAIIARSGPSEAVDAKAKRRWFRRGSTLAVMFFCCGMMHVIHRSNGPLSEQVLGFVGISVVFGIGILILTRMVFSLFGRERAMIAGILCANRNLALSFALLSTVLPPETIVFIAAAQFPIFLVPVLLRVARWFSNLGRRRKQLARPA